MALRQGFSLSIPFLPLNNITLVLRTHIRPASNRATRSTYREHCVVSKLMKIPILLNTNNRQVNIKFVCRNKELNETNIEMGFS